MAPLPRRKPMEDVKKVATFLMLWKLIREKEATHGKRSSMPTQGKER